MVGVEALEVSIDLLGQHHHSLSIFLHVFQLLLVGFLVLLRQLDTTHIDAVFEIEAAELVDDVVNDELVKSLKNHGIKGFLEEIDEAETPGLVTICVVPG